MLVTTGSIFGDNVSADTKLVAAVRDAQKLAAGGQLHAAVQSLEVTLEQGRDATDKRTIAIAWNELGRLYTDMGRLIEARKALFRSVELLKGVCAAKCAEYEHTLTNLASVYVGQREFARGQRILEQVLAARTERLGASDPALITLYANLANVHWTRRDRDNAERYARAALTLFESATDRHQVHMASTRNVLALIKTDKGDTQGAMEELRQALSIVERNSVADHPDLVPYLLNLGNLHMRLRQWPSAEMELNRALAIVEAKLGNQHPCRAESLMLLGRLYRKTGRGADAERAQESAETIAAGYRRQESLDSVTSIDDLVRGR
jgi:tetratricopeptide (TPR) repeat protein